MAEAIARGGLTCPKCGGSMRSYERSGVTVDQCSECRGVFLDRGELERLIDAEGAYYADRDDDRGDRGYDRGHERGRDDDRGGLEHRPAGKRKRKRFLEDLFEFGD